MKHFFSSKQTLTLFLILVVVFSTIVVESKKAKKKNLNNNAYVAASILKTLGAREDFNSLTNKFQDQCPQLNVVNSVKKSIRKINFLTSKKPMQIGFLFAKKALKKIFKKKKLPKKRNMFTFNWRSKFGSRRPFRGYPYQGVPNRRPYGRPYGQYPNDGPPNDYPGFLEKKVKKSNKSKKGKKIPKITPLKTNSVLKSICKGVNYPNAKSKLTGYKQLMKYRRIKLLGKVIKNTIRRVLANILGCKFMRKGELSNSVRRALKKIRNKTNLKANVLKIANVLKKVINHKKKPKLIKKTNDLMKKVLVKLLNRKKIKPSTLIILNNLKQKNCRASKICYSRKIYSRKCYMLAQGCLKLRSFHRKAKANKMGNVVSSLIKNFLSQ
jgi:hypothetical protein